MMKIKITFTVKGEVNSGHLSLRKQGPSQSEGFSRDPSPSYKCFDHFSLGHMRYILWLTDPDGGFQCLVGDRKKIKNKNSGPCFFLVGNISGIYDRNSTDWMENFGLFHLDKKSLDKNETQISRSKVM